MADTTYVDNQTPAVNADWLNDVNRLHYTILSDPADAAAVRTALNVENGATADQSDAEIETAYNNQVSAESEANARAGTSTTVTRWTAQRVRQGAAATAFETINTQSGTTYTAVASDAGKLLKFTNAAAITLSLNNSVHAAGDHILVVQDNTGQITFGGTATKRYNAGFTNKAAARYSVVSVIWESATVCWLSGDLEAV